MSKLFCTLGTFVLFPALLSATQVSVVTHLEYVDRETSQLKIYNEKQDLDLEYLSTKSVDKMTTRTSFGVKDNRGDGRPLMMKISNSFGLLQGKELPRIDIRFSFFEKVIARDHTYTCTQKYYGKDECRVQLVPWDLGINSVGAKCKLRITGPDSLDFENSPSYQDALMFPSIAHKSSVNGNAFALSFDCYNPETNQSVVKGHFLHNAKSAPNL